MTLMLVEKKSVLQSQSRSLAASATTAPAPNLMLNTGELSKMSPITAVFFFLSTFKTI
jgi:hypothetical protein